MVCDPAGSGGNGFFRIGAEGWGGEGRSDSHGSWRLVLVSLGCPVSGNGCSWPCRASGDV